MKIEVGIPCLFCKCPLNIHSKPHLVFDVKKNAIKGVAHATCSNKADIFWYSHQEIDWGADYPSEEQVKFACKIIRVLQDSEGTGNMSDGFFIRILLLKCKGKTSSIDECLSLSVVKELLDWWVTGSKIMVQERAGRIVKMMRRLLETERGLTRNAPNSTI